MKLPSSQVDLLKQILENLRSPERLDAHPWAESLTVRDAAISNPSLASKSLGTQLVLTIGELFRQMMPASPPDRNGKRLDTRWGRFGILAANYFAPLLYGRLYPRSMREAWRRIDQAILLFVFGKPRDELKPEQVDQYQLLGDELNLPANSTISDWHRDGMQELADCFVDREKSLSLAAGQASPAREVDGKREAATKQRLSGWRVGVIAALAAVLVLLGLAGLKAYRFYKLVLPLRQDLAAVSALNAGALQLDTLGQLGPLLGDTHSHLAAVQAEAAPYFGLARQMAWIPVYGGDLKHAEDLVAVATDATDAASQTYAAAMPIVNAVRSEGDIGASQLTRLLIEAQPALLEAQSALGEAEASRARIVDAELSPGTRSLLRRLDPYLTSLDGRLSVALSVPGLLGATSTGPKTYLILVQNEDELRATGGFISAVAKAVVRNGELMDLLIQDSYAVDDMTKAYPSAPWQMQSFMNIPIMVFRDASWFTDYPTAVTWAEYLYAYTNSHSVDGIIAMDQHVLESVLSVTGPVHVSAIGATVSSENLRTVVRAQKVPPPPDQRDPEWHRKRFMNPISSAILQRLMSGESISWEKLLKVIFNELDERHVLVQLDDPTLGGLLAERGWDGAVRNPVGDFLMAVDTNVGYNKTNAVVQSRFVYDVDLTTLDAPRSNVAVFHHNDAQGQAGPCEQRPSIPDSSTVEAWYAIDRCYYNYLRVYVPAGTRLTGATLHAVTRDEMVMLEADVPARVDVLDEFMDGVQGFGTLLVVPMQGTLETGFQFDLPAGILQPGARGGEVVYALKVQKQAGTLAIPVTVRVHLPHGAKVESAYPEFTRTGDNLLFDLELRSDMGIRIGFRP